MRERQTGGKIGQVRKRYRVDAQRKFDSTEKQQVCFIR